MHESESGITIRVLHNMARSGGTLFSRCLGCMHNVILLSEIHPNGLAYFNPLRQAHEWFGLLTSNDIRNVRSSGGVSFNDGIQIIAERCMENGLALVIRDWSHLDYMALPFLDAPTYKPTISDTLRVRFRVVDAATVRHPIDQWLSLSRLIIMKENIDLDTFLLGYLRFAEYACDVGFVRYEDFIRTPDRKLAELCGDLELEFDPTYSERWNTYTKITGDNINRCNANDKINTNMQAPYDNYMLDKFYTKPDYREAINLLGYSHPA